MASGTSRSRNRIAGRASASPASVPNAASTRLSVRNCATSLPRPAPSAARTATSRPRAAPRDSSRFVRLTQAISSSAADAHSSRISAVRVLPAISSRRGVTITECGPREVLRRHLQTQRLHGLPRVLQRDAGLEPRDDLRVVPGEVRPHPRRERRRHPDVDVARGHEVEVPRHDADHFVGLVVQRDLASDDVGRAAEAALPQPVADHDDAHALVVLVLGEDAPEQRLHAEHAPEVPRDLPRREPVRVRHRRRASRRPAGWTRDP